MKIRKLITLAGDLNRVSRVIINDDNDDAIYDGIYLNMPTSMADLKIKRFYFRENNCSPVCIIYTKSRP